ncbi:hypothetical protein DJ93_445 [Bacillus clarus]|uniref:Uncharacterized protein n=1 Tax=Bacillus clarus TaxID=2338372 RepID=A0A090YT60_9BACI|nr:hypothetical protein DJ93_445 [Bacillus clarus]
MEVILFFLGIVVLIMYSLLKDKKRMDLTKRKLYVTSLIFTIVFSFIPTTGLNGEEFLYFGIPAQNFSYDGRGGSDLMQ